MTIELEKIDWMKWNEIGYVNVASMTEIGS